MDLVDLPRNTEVHAYSRPVEEAYFVLSGCLAVGWEERGHMLEDRLGPKDMILNPAGRVHYFRNDSVGASEFMMLVGTPRAEEIEFRIV
jgi:mannose-6-phosphate isomerase-like protein (cupin superfamily)